MSLAQKVRQRLPWAGDKGGEVPCWESLSGPLLGVMVCLLTAWLSGPVQAQTNDECLACHADKEIVKELPGGESVSVYVDSSALGRSAHSMLDCVSCHQDLAGTDFPHKETVAEVRCGDCHGDVAEEYDNSIHWRGVEAGDSSAPKCRDCHGAHYILPKDNPQSSIYRLNLPKTCGACHDNPDIIRRHDMRRSFSGYANSIHGKAVLKWGVIVAADCADCHGAHDIRKGSEPDSPVNRANVGSTCERCHPEAWAKWRRSVHGVVAAEGKAEAAVCTDCHGEHSIREPRSKDSSVYVTRIVGTCAKCHADKEIVGRFGVPLDRVATYRESFHGIGTKFGSTVVANCVSCHNHHDIKPASDPSSSINPANLKATCGQPGCHLGATDAFARGPVHISPLGTNDRLLRAIRLIYIVLVGLTIGGMIVHNTVDYLGRRRLRKVAALGRWPRS